MSNKQLLQHIEENIQMIQEESGMVEEFSMGDVSSLATSAYDAISDTVGQAANAFVKSDTFGAIAGNHTLKSIGDHIGSSSYDAVHLVKETSNQVSNAVQAGMPDSLGDVFNSTLSAAGNVVTSIKGTHIPNSAIMAFNSNIKNVKTNVEHLSELPHSIQGSVTKIHTFVMDNLNVDADPYAIVGAVVMVTVLIISIIAYYLFKSGKKREALKLTMSAKKAIKKK